MSKGPEAPKYVRAKEYIKGCILNGELKPGEKIFSENDLSSKFAISRHTVRQAFGELVNEGWLHRVQGKGTFVSRSAGMQKEKSRIIGVMTTYLDDYIFPSIIKGIDNVLSNQGYSMILSHTDNKIEREAACLSAIMEKNVDGFIIEPTKSALPNPNLGLYEELERKGIPYIFINGFYPGREASCVVEDDELGGYLAAMHLMELGHEKIGGIFKVDDIQGHGRYKGTVRAHRERGRNIPEDSVIWYTTEDSDSIFGETGRKLLLKRLEGCTGVVCYNDQVALRLIEIFKAESVRVPGDVSLVSFDDSELAVASETKLTTVAHPKAGLGEKAALGLLDLLRYNRNRVKEIMKPELIVRSSTSRRSDNSRLK